jgi:hypothetical protein
MAALRYVIFSMAPMPFPPEVPVPQSKGSGPPATVVQTGEMSIRETKGKIIVVKVG